MSFLIFGAKPSRSNRFSLRLDTENKVGSRSRQSGDQAKSWGAALRGGFLETCANAHCRSGWLHVWRNRSVPVFEGGWTCSFECSLARLTAAVRRELDGREFARDSHRHRIPLGLLMLEQGWINQEQLRQALAAQKKARTGRLGQWLIRQGAVNELQITRALGLQWSCPVLSLESYDAAGLTTVMPRLLMDAFGVLPLRMAASRLLYLGFEGRLDPILALAIERMTDLRIESGVIQGSLFRPAHARILNMPFPPVELIEAASESVAALAMARALERAKPVASRLVRVHNGLWLRMWNQPRSGVLPEIESIQDLLCFITEPTHGCNVHSRSTR